MGLLVEGTWKDRWYPTKDSGGRFVRQDANFRDRIGSERFPAVRDRYHLYVAEACPWAHRTLIYRVLKGLEDVLPVSIVHPEMLDKGWEFRDGYTDRLFDSACLHQVYTRAAPDFTGRVTVPVLWDTVEGTIVNNESSEIIRVFNSAFDDLTGNTLDFLPHNLLHAIDAANDRIYRTLNNGVYRCGFATTQEAYNEAVVELFDTLEWLEQVLGDQAFVAGDAVTEADWRLLPTLLRFDIVYVTHFKCDRKRIVDYPNLNGLMCQLMSAPGLRETFNAEAVRRHYFYSHETVNPHRIVSIGPVLDLDAPHDRGPLKLG